MQELKTQALSEQKKEEKKVEDSSTLALPNIEELLKAGVQFGHQVRRWNPKMYDYIYTSKNGIHIIDVTKTLEGLKKATSFLFQASQVGPVIFVSSKRQAKEILVNGSVEAGCFYVVSRWAGGLLTNFSVIKKSLDKLIALENSFESGIEGRTKYEVSRMKKEWVRLSKLYSGIKTLSAKPSAIVILDVNKDKVALKEAKKMGIPVVAIVDSNSDPENIDYLIPGNDDAIGSLTIISKTLFNAVKAGNKNYYVNHNLKDYSNVEVKITKKVVEEKKQLVDIEFMKDKKDEKVLERKRTRTSVKKTKGILEQAKEKAMKAKKEQKPSKKNKKSAKRETKKVSTNKKNIKS